MRMLASELRRMVVFGEVVPVRHCGWGGVGAVVRRDKRLLYGGEICGIKLLAYRSDMWWYCGDAFGVRSRSYRRRDADDARPTL
jgi:hypothetical protein